MTKLGIKVYLDKCIVWCTQHWRWLVLLTASLMAYALGRKNSQALKVQAELARDQYKKESEMLEKEHAKKQDGLKKASRKYNKALEALDKKYDDDTSKLRRDKDKHYKSLLKKAKNDPEQLDSLLKDMGINEV
tara:strand:+ start:152 stop:550 length:399 start_codon:yes stop_codon:yes gene_type:complete